MPDNDINFGFEETKSTILDYFLMFKEVKWAVATTMVVSIAIVLIIIGLMDTIMREVSVSSDPKISGLIVLGFATIFALSLWLPFSNGKLFLKIITKGRKQQKELLEIQSHLIRRSYLMNFELVEPEIIIKEGDSKLEKMMNHLSFVFPEIDRINKKRIKKAKSVEKYASKFKRKMHFLRNYDLGIKTSTGWYVVQFYENLVKFEDVEKIVKKFTLEKTLSGAEIQRIIIVGKEFDSSFKREQLSEKMTLLKRKIHVDIILEEEFGYSTIWID
jgi:hypothetical protein